ncbi:MAG TPA: hypothetical protein VLC46_01760 [Thermoanaerobaculia bacterium]|nr:hypothetical protein [Thermoanaerobaculia bacterium]
MSWNLASARKRTGKTLAILALAGAIAGALLVAALWLERRTKITLPIPTGPFAVGRAIDDWTDDTALDALAPVPGTQRELLVWIWYPAAAWRSAAADDYVPAQMRAAAGPAGGIWSLLTRDASKVHGHSIRNAGVASRQQSYPVVIMRAGASGRSRELLDTGGGSGQSWVRRRRIRRSLSHQCRRFS